MFFYIVLTSIGNTRKYQQFDIYIYQCDSWICIFVQNSPLMENIYFDLIYTCASLTAYPSVEAYEGQTNI